MSKLSGEKKRRRQDGHSHWAGVGAVGEKRLSLGDTSVRSAQRSASFSLSPLCLLRK